MAFDKKALRKNVQDRFSLDPKKNLKATLDVDPANVFRTGATQAKKLQAKQSEAIERQDKLTNLRDQEAKSEIEERRALTKKGRGGRQSLINSGQSTNLGGT